ncbi:MAG: MoxR family ATPase [Leptolyngbyaceae bacterium]|nr:MoxR family ATPase [Leptolyngbyaceae bacterium]
MRESIQRLTDNLSKAIVGKEDAIRLVLTALFSGGHVLLEDVPGVGKTLLAKSLASSIDGSFKRVQCTPDLLPTDVTGTNIWNPQTGQFEFLQGPVFANVLLADEINRATPRTQSALLEVMEEHQVTTDGVSRAVPHPFFVIATQNPVEYQGTFPLPEAQMDRFSLALSLGYPSEAEELQILRRLQGNTTAPVLQPCISLEEVAQLQQVCSTVSVLDDVQHYILDLVRATRDHENIRLGVSPRGSVALFRCSQALAWLKGRDFVQLDDIKELAIAVLSHRIIPTSGHRSSVLVQQLLESIPNSVGA